MFFLLHLFVLMMCIVSTYAQCATSEECQRQCASGETEACASLLNSCSCYDPCADKINGAECTLCDPKDGDCVETQELKTCQSGVCEPSQ